MRVEPQASVPGRLRWWFWLVLFLPAIVSPLIPGIVSVWAPPDPGRAHAWVLGVSLYTFASN